MVSLNTENPAPLYLQLRDSIVCEITAGRLKRGSKLGSVRSVAADFGINPATVKQSYDLLQEQGIVVTRGRQGTFVAVNSIDLLVQQLGILLDQGFSAAEIRSCLAQLEQEHAR
ncbi:GntR family transcriptional regulator [Corynebacterium hindlerae]|uniref:GntR family transcriptional regulator n=1 Tax=Corynebacterium hindlerae TaxID=699041 RepID=A0A7G5FGL7_9CORY|nr:GntR family transcriptional regulator [Corynebacterium hindlerae]QMV85758.1 GntR family transcriptional regulator [Corynebacterium hindlerae]